ncbi:MAG: hypothetical protein WA728_31485, partial [Xanthobacteraceae bacterium]
MTGCNLFPEYRAKIAAQQAAEDDAKCQGYGAKVGEPDYVQCRVYALTAQQARALGLLVKVGMPPEVMRLMSLYPQPIQRSGVEYLPIDVP